MSVGAFVAGAAVGGLQYGLAKFQLFERENVVAYSVGQAREQLHPRASQVRAERWRARDGRGRKTD